MLENIFEQSDEKNRDMDIKKDSVPCPTQKKTSPHGEILCGLFVVFSAVVHLFSGEITNNSLFLQNLLTSCQ